MMTMQRGKWESKTSSISGQLRNDGRDSSTLAQNNELLGYAL